ncbi:putative short chain dehydrogenase/ reductase [Macrophomina phaseolina]|uniref:Short chain dehydrogenase/ reductase n=1 Tax=Macrophomina phaseolina TaxID=35725 RepID=A0ABQ8FVD8_9PEZI|nr:putative short chain dehydrogenase/ reductase [Macrophomina phaseolina]
MTALDIKEEDIPRLDDKVVIVTGTWGSSGIGLATARIFQARGAHVHVLDLHPVDEDFDCFCSPWPAAAAAADRARKHATDTAAAPRRGTITYRHCDVADWTSLRQAFADIGHVDIAVANAGVSEHGDFFADALDEAGLLAEPRYAVIDVNLRAVLNFIKLSVSVFRRQRQQSKGGGAIVLTSSATAYAPELSLPVYSAVKLSVVGLVRALRPSIQQLCGATINSVAPAATVSKLLPPELAGPIVAAGGPVSTAHHVGLAVAYSATARQVRQVERYGRESETQAREAGRWNGRVILTLGNRWTELEESVAELRPQWMGEWNAEMTAFQQALTDSRPAAGSNGVVRAEA